MSLVTYDHPQTSEAQNNVFGRTLNPWNTAINPGGSSGGEGALIALRGSPLGVGTDIGGTNITHSPYHDPKNESSH